METATPAAPSVSIVRERDIRGERVIFLGPSCLVASQFLPRRWHTVQDGTCDCSAFAEYGRCLHLRAALEAAELDRREAVAVLSTETARTRERPRERRTARC